MPSKPSALSSDRSDVSRFEGFALPTSNTTYCPNQLFDVCLPNCSRGCVRLVAYLIRKTLGWSDAQGRPQTEQHRVSFNDLHRKAGISRDMIRSAVDEAIDGHFIKRVELGRPNSAGRGAVSAVYELCWDEGLEYIKKPKQFRGFFAGEGNRTYIPNQFFDVLIPNETLAIVKVVGSVIRFSIGFQTKWGHRRQLISLSYQDIQNYTHLRDRTTLASAIKTAMQKNYLKRVEEGIFDPNAGRLSRPATYAVKWLNDTTESPSGQKSLPGQTSIFQRSEIATGNGQKSLPGEWSENPTDIQIKQTNRTLKQQQPYAVVFERLRNEGFDSKAAEAISLRYPAQRISRQIDWLKYRRIKSNRLGLLRSAIEQDWSLPGGGGKQLGASRIQRELSRITFGEAIDQARRRFLREQPHPKS